MKRLPLLLSAVVLVVYFVYIGLGIHDCVKRGGVPVWLPFGVQCAAKLGQKVP